MKEVKLTHGYVALVDDEDYDRVSQYVWHAKIDHRTVYAATSMPLYNDKLTNIRLHRFVMNIYDSEVEVDHRDHNGLNCQKHNLRVASSSQNSRNMRPHRLSASGFKGVIQSNCHRKWRAKIKVDGKSIDLGTFKLAEDAAKAYDVAALKYFGEFAYLNFPHRADATSA
jgi:hypothetical protein